MSEESQRRSRTYQSRPLVGVGAVVVQGNRFLMVKRKNEPGAARWTLPGGMVEYGEPVSEAIVREVREECGICVRPVRLVDVIDFFESDEHNQAKFHYVLIDFECEYLGGVLAASSDVSDVRWVPQNEVESLSVPQFTADFLREHFFV